MRVGVPKETKDNESRVALTPDGVAALTGSGHEVLVERGAGAACGFGDDAYDELSRARLGSAADAWAADLVVKVKEPLLHEYGYFRRASPVRVLPPRGAPPALTNALIASRTTAVAYETVEDERGRLPLLAPMSAIAGSMAPLMGAYYLAKFNGGRGTAARQRSRARTGRVVIGDGVAAGTPERRERARALT